MAGRAAPLAFAPSGERRCRFRRLAEMAQSNAPAASDRLAPARDAGQATSRQRPLPDARMCGGEVSLQPLRFPRSHSSRGGEVSLSFEEDSEAVEARRRVGVRTAEHLIADRERPL